jgi:hypothetical protein
MVTSQVRWNARRRTKTTEALVARVTRTEGTVSSAGRVVPFETLDEPACLGGGEGFVERGGLVGVGLYLRLNTASNPSSTSWRLVRSIVAMLVSSAAAIRLSLQPISW